MSSASGTGRISIKQWFDQLRPGQRKTVWFCLLATGIVALSYGSYRISRGGAPEAPPRKETLREILNSHKTDVAPVEGELAKLAAAGVSKRLISRFLEEYSEAKTC